MMTNSKTKNHHFPKDWTFSFGADGINPFFLEAELVNILPYDWLERIVDQFSNAFDETFMFEIAVGDKENYSSCKVRMNPYENNYRAAHAGLSWCVYEIHQMGNYKIGKN